MRFLKISLTIFFLVFSCCFIIMHMRLQSTILGYQIGTLKTKEVELFKEKSRLSTELAKASTKKMLLSKSKSKTKSIQ